MYTSTSRFCSFWIYPFTISQTSRIPHTKAQSWEQGKHSWSPNTHMGLVNKPETFLQLLLSPPQTLHLSNFFLEPSFPSQPALMHLPWTQTEVESGEQGVPSTTLTR